MNKLAPILHSQQYAYKASPAQIIGYVYISFFFFALVHILSLYVQSFLYNVLSLTLILGLVYKQREETASRNNFSKQTLNSLAI
jgi:uncharacterized membrane protein YjgN (DUF898 family)